MWKYFVSTSGFLFEILAEGLPATDKFAPHSQHEYPFLAVGLHILIQPLLQKFPYPSEIRAFFKLVHRQQRTRLEVEIESHPVSGNGILKGEIYFEKIRQAQVSPIKKDPGGTSVQSCPTITTVFRE